MSVRSFIDDTVRPSYLPKRFLDEAEVLERVDERHGEIARSVKNPEGQRAHDHDISSRDGSVIAQASMATARPDNSRSWVLRIKSVDIQIGREASASRSKCPWI
jgi:hypothetical protein